MPTQADSLFQKAVDAGASDVPIAVGSSVLQTSADEGMVSFKKDFKRLLKEGQISQETYEGV